VHLFMLGTLTPEQVKLLYNIGSQQLAPSPKDDADNIEALELTRVLAHFDNIEGTELVDLAVVASARKLKWKKRRQPEIIAGRVNADGTIAAGDGFTVSKGGTGNYTITFAPGLRLTVAVAELRGGLVDGRKRQATRPRVHCLDLLDCRVATDMHSLSSPWGCSNKWHFQLSK
jgi:hypothetical protein